MVKASRKDNKKTTCVKLQYRFYSHNSQEKQMKEEKALQCKDNRNLEEQITTLKVALRVHYQLRNAFMRKFFAAKCIAPAGGYP